MFRTVERFSGPLGQLPVRGTSGGRGLVDTRGPRKRWIRGAWACVTEWRPSSVARGAGTGFHRKTAMTARKKKVERERESESPGQLKETRGEGR
eukprot:1151693-Pleurochrysis_carterae.AAC.1